MIIGLPALRIRGLMLAVTTLAFAVATSSFLLNRDQTCFPVHICPTISSTASSGSRSLGRLGVSGHRAPRCRAERDRLLLRVPARARCSCCSRCAGSAVARSRDLVATRDNERNAQAFRLSPTRAKLLAFALAGFFASFAGGMLALHQQALGQDIFAPVESIRALTMVVVGGLGSVPGRHPRRDLPEEHRVVHGDRAPGARFLFQFAGSGIGLILVLWLLPGGSRARSCTAVA